MQTTRMKQQTVAKPLTASCSLLKQSCIPRVRKLRPVVAAGSRIICAAGVAHPSEESHKSEPQSSFSPMLGVPNVTMARGGGFGSNSSFGAGAAGVLERAKVEFVMPTPPVAAPKLDDGGSGGDSGGGKEIGGGGGGGDGGDDDDFFEEGGDGEGEGEGDGAATFFRAVAIAESYDKLSIGAVLAEWMKAISDLPLIIRRSVEMGLFSSAQLVRFFAMDVRPNVTRTISRSLPPTWAREVVGRLMADPGFIQKMVLEAGIAAASNIYYEYLVRGERFKHELDLVAINTIGMAAASGAFVYLTAPSRSFGTVHKFPWQQMLSGLPNCVFQAAGPLQNFSLTARAGSLVAKAGQFAAVGSVTAATTSLLSQAAISIRKRANPDWEPSIAVPDMATSSAGLAAWAAANANLRYQVVGGLDRFLFDRCNHLWFYVLASGAARLASNRVGELSRPLWQGLPEARPRPLTKKVRKVVKKVVTKARQQPQQELQTPLEAAAVLTLAGATEVASASAPSVNTYSASESAASTSAPTTSLDHSSQSTTTPSPHAFESTADMSSSSSTYSMESKALAVPSAAEVEDSPVLDQVLAYTEAAGSQQLDQQPKQADVIHAGQQLVAARSQTV